MKRLRNQIVLLLLCLSVWLLCCGFDREQPHLIDDAMLFDEREAEELEALLIEASEECGVDLLLLTTYDLSYRTDPYEYMGKFIRTGGYGYGQERYTCLLMIDMGNRVVYAYEWSSDINKYHLYLQAELDQIVDEVFPLLKERSYVQAAKRFVRYAKIHSDDDKAPLEAYQYTGSETRYDINGRRKINWQWIGISAAVAAAAGAIAVWLAVRQHAPSTVKNPRVYSDREKFAVLNRMDRFSHTTTVRTKIESSGGGGGGGHHGGGSRGGGHGSSRRF